MDAETPMHYWERISTRLEAEPMLGFLQSALPDHREQYTHFFTTNPNRITYCICKYPEVSASMNVWYAWWAIGQAKALKPRGTKYDMHEQLNQFGALKDVLYGLQFPIRVNSHLEVISSHLTL